MDFKRNPLLLLCLGLLIGIVVAEVVYYIFDPLVLPEGAIEVVTDQEYYPKVSEILSGSKESIHMVMFSANYQTGQYADGSVNRLLQELVAARNRGVDVQVVMDDWPEGNNKTINYLVKNNVPARMINIDGTTHAKLIVADGIVVVGSTNWAYTSIEKNHEANVVIRDERVAREFEDYFRRVSA